MNQTNVPGSIPGAAQLTETTTALGELYQGFLELLPGLVFGLLVLGLFYLLSGVARRAILRAAPATVRRSGGWLGSGSCSRACSWVWRWPFQRSTAAAS